MHFLAFRLPPCLCASSFCWPMLPRCKLHILWCAVLCYDCSSTMCSNLSASTRDLLRPNQHIVLSLQDSPPTAGGFTPLAFWSQKLFSALWRFSVENSLPEVLSKKGIWQSLQSSSLKYMFTKLIIWETKSPLSPRYLITSLSTFGFWVYVNHVPGLRDGS